MDGRVEPAGTNLRRRDNAPRNAVPGQIMPNVRIHDGPLEPRPALGPNPKQPTNDARPNRIASVETIEQNAQTEDIHVQTNVRLLKTNVGLVPTNAPQRLRDNIAATIAKLSVTNSVDHVENASGTCLEKRFVETTDKIREHLGRVVETNGADLLEVERTPVPNSVDRGKTAQTLGKNGTSNTANGLVDIRRVPRKTALHHATSKRNVAPQCLPVRSCETNVLR